jgi:hypothetical protein
MQAMWLSACCTAGCPRIPVRSLAGKSTAWMYLPARCACSLSSQCTETAPKVRRRASVSIYSGVVRVRRVFFQMVHIQMLIVAPEVSPCIMTRCACRGCAVCHASRSRGARSPRNCFHPFSGVVCAEFCSLSRQPGAAEPVTPSLVVAHEKRNKDTDNFLVTGDDPVKHPN